MCTNIKQVIDFYQPNNEISIQALMLILLIPVIVFFFVKDLKLLAPFSAFSNFLMMSSLMIILYEIFFTGSFKKMNEIKLIAPINEWPIFFSTVIYAFEGIPLVLPVYNKMLNKQDFGHKYGVLNVGMLIISLMYLTIGLFGYLKYGDEAYPTITLNLPVSNVNIINL